MRRTAWLTPLVLLTVGARAQDADLRAAIRSGDVAAARAILDKERLPGGILSADLMNLAASVDRREIMLLLLEKGAPVNAADGSGVTALHTAA